MNEPTATVETPAASRETFSLAKFRESETRETPAVPAVDDAPDPEVEADPELRKAIDELEAPKPEETPQEKRARTLKHKAAARKGFETRQANKVIRLEREIEELRRAPQAPAGGPTAPVAANQPAARQAETDASDPEPTFESFAAAHPDHPDVYAGFVRAQAAWDRREEQRADKRTADASKRDATQRELVTRFGEHRDAGNSSHADFETSLGALGSALRNHPADEVVFKAVGAIPDKAVGGEVLYRLGRDIAETRAAAEQGEIALLMHIGQVRAVVTAEAKAKAVPTASPVVTNAPPPHTPVGAVTHGTPQNPASKAGTKLSLRELRAFEAAHGRRR